MKNSDTVLVNAVAKVISCICVLLAVIMLSQQCKVDSKTIIECTEACQSETSRMKSVTSQECICISKADSRDEWISIPRP